MTPHVTIVMPCYNGKTFLPRSIGSVQAQNYADWELILVDDGSTDGSADWAEQLDDPRIRVLRQRNAGVSAARNAGIEKAAGRFIAFLDTDDEWAPTFLDRMMEALRTHPHAVLAYCGWRKTGLEGRRNDPFIPPDYENPEKHATLFIGCRWPIHAALSLTESVRKAGGFTAYLRNAEDYALWLEIATENQIVRVAEVLAVYHFHSDAQASANRRRSAEDLLHAQELHIKRHPDFARRMGRRRLREMMLGNVLRVAYEAYWRRDFETARPLFHLTILSGYGTRSDWCRMLPALLPAKLHIRLINFANKLRKR